MKPTDTVSVTRVHPAMADEEKRRRRVRFWAIVATAAAISAGLAVALLWAQARSGSGLRLLSPGLLVPLSLLAALIVAALAVKTLARAESLSLIDDRLTLEPGPVARVVLRKDPVRIELASVDRVRVFGRPVGNFLVFFQGERLAPVPIFLESGDLLRKLLDAVPDYTPGLPEARTCLDAVLSPAEYRRLTRQVRALPAPSTRPGEEADKLLDCHEALGCWILAARDLWSRIESAPDKGKVESAPDRGELLRRLHRVERMRLGYTALLAFLDRLSRVLVKDQDVGADRLRLALALRFRHDARELMDILGADAPESAEAAKEGATEGATESGLTRPPLPLDDWRMVFKHRPPFGGSIPVVTQRRFRVEDGKLISSHGGAMPLAMLVAFLPVRGFAGTRALRLFDAWGQHHDMELGGSAPGGLDHAAFRLMDQAPHIMELHEDSTWSLGLRRNLRKLAIRP